MSNQQFTLLTQFVIKPSWLLALTLCTASDKQQEHSTGAVRQTGAKGEAPHTCDPACIAALSPALLGGLLTGTAI